VDARCSVNSLTEWLARADDWFHTSPLQLTATQQQQQQQSAVLVAAAAIDPFTSDEASCTEI